MKKLFALLIILIAGLFLWESGAKYFPALKKGADFKAPQLSSPRTSETIKVLREENVVTDVVKSSGPSVITMGVEQLPLSNNALDLGPFGSFFNQPPAQDFPNKKTDNFIGSGFVIKSEGIIVTNKHVVSDNTLKYLVIDDKGNKFKVDRIYRDPSNDIAIIKTSGAPPGGFKEIKLGDSTKLEVGQFVIAIGTALGEFRNTVTTGVVSGLGRGITAGSPLEGISERLDNVIQTDAAINPGNSGGPLLNSSGQVIGINSAVASQGQNIGFAIPINTVKDSLNNFNETGQFNRPYLGVAYKMISKQAALANEVPQGAYVSLVVPGSSADKGGVKVGDIIVKFDGNKLSDTESGLANFIARKKVGNVVTLSVFRETTTLDLKITLQQAPGE